MRRVIACLSLALAAGGSISAQRTVANPFAGMTAFSCRFSLKTVVTWSDSEPSAEIVRDALSFQLKDVNPDEGTARLTETTGDRRIVSRVSGSNLYFLDIRPDGTLTTTTLFEKGPKETRLRAIHSRTHYYRYVGPDFVSVPEVEQFYGFCEAVE